MASANGDIMPVIDCLKICEEMRSTYDLSNQACLHIIQIGNNQVNDLYISSKLKECEKWNIKCVVDRFNGDEPIECMKSLLDQLNRDYNVDGIIIQLPTNLDKHDEDYLLNSICSSKDVDGLSHDTFTPCTPKGIMWLLDDIGIDNKVISIVGRGKLVGEPLANILKKKKCTLIQMNSSTRPRMRNKLLMQSDIIISAVGQPNLFNGNNIPCGEKWVIDAGISRVDGKQVGDFSHIGTRKGDLIHYTPYTNGVGKLTVASLMSNVREAREKKELL